MSSQGAFGTPKTDVSDDQYDRRHGMPEATHPARQILAVGTACLIVLTAGCGAFNPLDATTTTPTTSPPTQEKPTSTLPSANPEHELRIWNRGNETVAIAINITTNTTTAFTTNFQLQAGATNEYTVTYPRDGTYTIAVAVGNRTATYTKQFQSRDPTGILEVRITDHQLIRFVYIAP